MKSYREIYQEGLLDVCQFLCTEMKGFLIKENRFKFRVEKFWGTILKNFKEVNSNVSEEDSDNYGRVLYLLRKNILSDYRFLRTKRMSPADCTITIIHRLLEISESLGEFRFSQEQREIKSVIDILWENIKHQAKTHQLKYLGDRITTSIEKEVRGTLSTQIFSLEEIEEPKIKEQKLKSETKFYKDSPNVKEISL